MSSLRRSALINSGSQWLMYIISFVKIAVVSRLLGPEELGTFTIAASLVFLAGFLRIFGVWEFIVAEKELTLDTRRRCFAILLIAGIAVTALFLGIAWPLAILFEAPDLIILIWVMIPSFLILPIGGISMALMQREMNFMALAKIRLGGTLVDTTVSIGLTLAGFGVVSLGWGYTASNIASVLIVGLLVSNGLFYKPLFTGTGPILRFGWKTAFGTFLSNITQSGPPLVLGLGTNTGVVGFFGRGQALITFFRQGIEYATRPVTQSWFAQLARSDESMVAATYLRITAIIAGVAWPVYIGLFFGAPTLVPFLLGTQWQDSVPVTQILALGGFLSFYQTTGVSLLEGLGLMGRRLRFNILAQLARFSLLALSLVFGGLLLFSAALALSHIVSFLLITQFLKTETGLQLSDVIKSQRRSGVIASGLVVISLLMFGFVFEDAALGFGEFAVYFMAMLVVWIGLLVATKHVLWQEVQGVLERQQQRNQS